MRPDSGKVGKVFGIRLIEIYKISIMVQMCSIFGNPIILPRLLRGH